ncbi:microtubule-associated protein futsch isoform X4 [Palaemon carinicauda]|uniref:microtubule-associated protein futsch isoform X4 n=1 Tax=Palaemon carinicauda TaxID=392227 RepID=UPI0035B69FAE
MSLVVHKLVLSPGGATTNAQNPTHHVTLAAYTQPPRSNVGETMGRSLDGSSSVSVSAPPSSSFYSSSSSKHSSSYNLPFVLQDHNYGAPPPPTPPQSPPPPPLPTASSPSPHYHSSSRQVSSQHQINHLSSSSSCSISTGNVAQHNHQQIHHSHILNQTHTLQHHHHNNQHHHPSHHPLQQQQQQRHQHQEQVQHQEHVHHQKSHVSHQQTVSSIIVPSPRVGIVTSANPPVATAAVAAASSTSVSSLCVSQHPLSVMPPHRQQFMPHPKGILFPSPHIPPLPLDLHHSPSAAVVASHPPPPPPPPLTSTIGPETDDDSRLSDRSSSVGPSGEETETAPEGEGDEQPVDDSITRCICEFSHDDGYMIQCDRCFVWQHVDCMEIDRDNIPDEYLCEACEPRHVDRFRARDLQIRRRQEIKAHLASSRTSALSRLSSSDSDDNLPMSNKSRGSGGKSTERKVVKKKKAKQIKDVKSNKKGSLCQVKKGSINNSCNNNNVPETDERERRILVKTRRRKSSSMSGCEGVSDDSVGPVERLRAWVEDYEKAVTNHYSPELRARVHAARINGVSPDLRASTQGALLGHRCKVVPNPHTLFDIFDSKILVAATRLTVNTAIAEYQGKYLLASQWNAQQSISGQVYFPYVLQYHMPKEGLSVCVDARTYGNDARFTRRSCKPNAEVRHVVERGSLHLYLVATRDIEEGEEVMIALETANSTVDLICCYPGEHVCLHSPPPKTEHSSPCHQTFSKKNGVFMISSSSKKTVRKLNLQPQLRMSKRTTSTDSRTSDVVPVIPPVQSSNPITPITPVKQRRTSGCGKSPVKSPSSSSTSSSPEDVCKEASHTTPPTTACTLSPDTPKAVDKQQQKMTREERKIAAYMKAFERMEKAAQRRQEMEKKKEEDKGKDSKDKDKKRTVVEGDDDDWEKNSSADESVRNTPNTDRSRRKGKKGRGKGSPQKRNSRIESTASDFTGDESSCASVGLMSPVSGTIEGIALNFNSPPQGGSNNTIGFRFPKTKKALMNEWLNETVDPVMPTVCSISVGDLPSGVPTCYMRSPATPLRRSVSVTQGTISSIQGTFLNLDMPGGSAKKRWLRQAISEESETPHFNGLCPSPNSRPDSPTGVGDYITPLKKRRLARESMSSEQSSTPPTTPVHLAAMEDDKSMEEMEAELEVASAKNKNEFGSEDQSPLIPLEKSIKPGSLRGFDTEERREITDNDEEEEEEENTNALGYEEVLPIKRTKEKRGKKMTKKSSSKSLSFRGVNSCRSDTNKVDIMEHHQTNPALSLGKENVEDPKRRDSEDEEMGKVAACSCKSEELEELNSKVVTKGGNKKYSVRNRRLNVGKKTKKQSEVGLRKSDRQHTFAKNNNETTKRKGKVQVQNVKVEANADAELEGEEIKKEPEEQVEIPLMTGTFKEESKLQIKEEASPVKVQIEDCDLFRKPSYLSAEENDEKHLDLKVKVKEELPQNNVSDSQTIGDGILEETKVKVKCEALKKEKEEKKEDLEVGSQVMERKDSVCTSDKGDKCVPHDCLYKDDLQFSREPKSCILSEEVPNRHSSEEKEAENVTDTEEEIRKEGIGNTLQDVENPESQKAMLDECTPGEDCEADPINREENEVSGREGLNSSSVEMSALKDSSFLSFDLGSKEQKVVRRKNTSTRKRTKCRVKRKPKDKVQKDCNDVKANFDASIGNESTSNDELLSCGELPSSLARNQLATSQRLPSTLEDESSLEITAKLTEDPFSKTSGASESRSPLERELEDGLTLESTCTPEVIRPCTPEIKGPCTPETKGPCTPETKGPCTPESKGPCTPESKGPCTPESKGPCTPESKGHRTPESKGPCTPESKGHRTPEVTGPFTPESKGHRTPEVTGPFTPESKGPCTPESKGPCTPESKGLCTPEITGPLTPESKGLLTPEITGPFTPKIKGPRTPEITRRCTSEIRGPRTPENKGPHTPEITGPHTPEITGPYTPEIKGPRTPEITGRCTPENKGPRTPEIAGRIPEITGPRTPENKGPRTPEVKGPRTPEGPAPSSPEESSDTPPSPRSPAAELERRMSPLYSKYDVEVNSVKDGVIKCRGPCTPLSEPPQSPAPSMEGVDDGEKIHEVSSADRDFLEDTDIPVTSSFTSAEVTSSQAKPAPVKRKLSILEYRKRKSVSSEVDGKGTAVSSSSSMPSSALLSFLARGSLDVEASNISVGSTAVLNIHSAVSSSQEGVPGVSPSSLSSLSKGGYLLDAESPPSPPSSSPPDLPLSPIQPLSLLLIPDVLDKSALREKPKGEGKC